MNLTRSSSAQVRWNALAPREKTLTLLAAGLLAALLCWIGIGPAWGTLRSAQLQQQGLEAQLQQMKSLQAEAQALQAQPRLGHEEALRALQASVTQRLGPSAQLNVAGERATLTLQSIPAEVLASWLTQARINARAFPTEAHLTRGPAGPATTATWDGTLVLSLPAR
ncbi:type II secretion system protein GspM [Polaromonas sp.]|jgi:general secretion pathway protein M|uniref:type II secretion system protein GspM n=1 Tax=Polaromonas sp. TaxID=1869339 RepID=UPI0037CB2B9C